MKLPSKNKRSKKYLILVSLLVIMLMGGYFGAAFIWHLWPFYSEVGHNTRMTELSQREGTSTPPATSENPTENTGDHTAYQTLTPPEIEQPTDATPFPIENARYRIEQTGELSFDVTLFAVINSSSQYNDYQTQLREYKNEVQSYLNNRFKDKNINITWNPKDANSL